MLMLGAIKSSGRVVHTRWLQQLLLGAGRPDPLKRQGYRQLWNALRSDYQTDRSFGILRLLRLLLVAATILFPVVHIDTVADWIIQRCSRRPHATYVDARIVAVYRDGYFLARALFLVGALFLSWQSVPLVRFMSAYFILEITHAWLGRALAWGRRSINPLRALVLAIINYAEVTTAFAVLYLACNCVTLSVRPTTALQPTTALYFSLVTATTVGVPHGVGYPLVISQLAVFFVFVVVVVSSLATYLPQQVRPRHY